MPEKNYLNFDLFIERFKKRYRARVINSPAGEASVDFNRPFSKKEIDNFYRTIDRIGELAPQDKDVVKDFGERLFTAVFGNKVLACFRSSLDQASVKNAGLRIRLHVNAPELANLPWEYLFNSGLNRFLALQVETPIVRYIELEERIQALTIKPPLKILVMISTVTDSLHQLDVDREWQLLNEALADLVQRGLVRMERLAQATLAALQQRLRQGSYDVFHFVGHGIFDEEAQDGMLLMHDDDNRRELWVSGKDLGTLLHNHSGLRLAILNACYGARTSITTASAGAAQRLVEQGIPAVIAMQFRISDAAAIAFVHEFYAALADGYPVDAALVEARVAIFSKGNDMEWGTPVLFMRSPDGKIFDWENKPALAIDTRVKDRIKIPELLPYLSDRSEQQFKLREALQEFEPKKPRRPFIGIVHGDERECHDMFCVRLQKDLLPNLLRLDTEQELIATYVHEWPVAEGNPLKRFEQLQASLARTLTGSMSAELPELVKIIAQHETPVLIRAHLATEVWQKNETELLHRWLDFWNSWPDLILGRRLFVFLNIQYKRAIPRPFLLKPKSEKRNDEVREAIKRIDFSAYQGLAGVVLPELKGITQSEVEDWVRQYACQFCHPHELFPKVRELFDAAKMERIPMEILAIKLKALLEQHRC